MGRKITFGGCLAILGAITSFSGLWVVNPYLIAFGAVSVLVGFVLGI